MPPVTGVDIPTLGRSPTAARPTPSRRAPNGGSRRAPGGRIVPLLLLAGLCGLAGYATTSRMLSPAIAVSQLPLVPAPTYVVQQGDTLGGIAHSNGISLAQLLAVGDNGNRFTDVNRIRPGQTVELPHRSVHDESGQASGGNAPAPTAFSDLTRRLRSLLP